MNVGDEQDTDFQEFKRRKSDKHKIWGYLVQIFPMLMALTTGFMVIKTDITTVAVRMESIQQSLARVDSELIRLREAEARRAQR